MSLLRAQPGMGFAGGTLAIFSTDAAIHAVSFGIRLVLAALLGARDFGLVILLLLVVEYAEKFFRFAVDEAAVYLAGRGRAPAEDLLWHCLPLSILLGLLPIPLVLAVQEPLRLYLIKIPVLPTYWLGIVLAILPFVFVYRAACKFLLFRNAVGWYNILTSVVPVLGGGMAILAVGVAGAGVGGVLVATGVAYVVAAMWAVAVAGRGLKRPQRFSGGLWRDLLGYGLRMYVSNGVQYLHYRSDVILVAFFLDPAAVGFYSIAVAMAEATRKVPGAFSALLFPRAARLSAGEAAALSAKTCRYSLALLALLSLPAYCMAWLLVPRFLAAPFAAVLAPLAILLPGMLAMAVSQLLMVHFYGRGFPHVVLRAAGAALIVNLGLNLILIPGLGILGAAWASTISYGICATLLVCQFAQREDWRVRDILMLGGADLVSLRQRLGGVLQS